MCYAVGDESAKLAPQRRTTEAPDPNDAMAQMTKRLIIGLSGASGVIYGVRLLDALGEDFVLLARGWRHALPPGVRLVEIEGVAADRLGLAPGGAVLVRPDQYVAARWQQADAADVAAALLRAKGGKPCLS